ncbi:metal ABC transporter ATP-binding protein [Rhodospirillum centenum]|uniref:Zinc transport system ATP-binding protein TroB n=1 Tax=Rhodospirillum centenum (strain ATCC 51521 / SW) TaxID=414684 RepID=B6IUL8_RHOCS|nr:ABC transporter ATP-binding protein [Rhodospirillum centenum]ACI99843.1 zinc transport system ATP-binding protein TroB [Rhodospirillum centenum SW]
MLQRIGAHDVVPPRESGVAPLAVRGLTVAYHDRPVLRDVNWTAPSAGLIAICGPNGAGKSTFIKACLGLVPPLSGTVEIFGRSLARQRRLVGYVPQRESVDWDFPVSALDVVAMGRYAMIGWGRRVSKEHKEAARAALERVGMGAFADRQIGQLSGGQQQRVFLARALAQEAHLYFMDEPLAGVDAATEQAVLEVMRELDRQGRTVLCVHHDLQTVAQVFDHVLLLNTRVVAEGSTRTTLTEANLRATYGQRLLDPLVM